MSKNNSNSNKNNNSVIKTYFYIISIIVLAISLLLLSMLYNKQEKIKALEMDIKKHNLEFQKYDREDLKGSDIASLINYTVDHNRKEINKTKEELKKGNTFNKSKEEIEQYKQYINDNNLEDEYKDNHYSTVNIDLILKKDIKVPMVNIIKSNMENFRLYLSDANFKLEKIEYHKNGKISYMQFRLLSDRSINTEKVVENIE